MLENRVGPDGDWLAWDTKAAHDCLVRHDAGKTLRTTERVLVASGLLPQTVSTTSLQDEYGTAPRALVVEALEADARRRRATTMVVQSFTAPDGSELLFANDARKGRRWVFVQGAADDEALLQGLIALAGTKDTLMWPHGALTARIRRIAAARESDTVMQGKRRIQFGLAAYHEHPHLAAQNVTVSPAPAARALTHLDRLEAESIHIIREVVAQAERPVMLYSIGKDSSVMLHLARKAFFPGTPPFPLMHVDTRWKFQAMYAFRDEIAKSSGMDLIVHINPEGIEKDINPFDHGSKLHTDVMKTQGLKQALDQYGFDVAFGGARRDEEKSRAKERVFSFRTRAHRWDPKNQRPELWRLYNGYKMSGESIRVFPLSNWTELDIWQYIYREDIPIVPLYYAAERPVVERDGMLLMVDDDRMRLLPGEQIKVRRVRFRTLGCYPLTGAIESAANDLSSIVLELLESRTSERQGRAIDSDTAGSMEKKKQEGYF
ncbi:MAG: sulfate adenylyltransferase subunit CysD [Pseudomonadales bacterium]|nr:sulfate adenylyltransferase subunit CysD [Pseudomonadales bacterium]